MINPPNPKRLAKSTTDRTNILKFKGDALEIYQAIGEDPRFHSVIISNQAKKKGVPIAFHCIALPVGTAPKPIKGVGGTPEDAVMDLESQLANWVWQSCDREDKKNIKVFK